MCICLPCPDQKIKEKTCKLAYKIHQCNTLLKSHGGHQKEEKHRLREIEARDTINTRNDHETPLHLLDMGHDLTPSFLIAHAKKRTRPAVLLTVPIR